MCIQDVFCQSNVGGQEEDTSKRSKWGAEINDTICLKSSGGNGDPGSFFFGEQNVCGNVEISDQAEVQGMCAEAGGVCGEICFMNEKGRLSQQNMEEAWSALAVGQG